MTELIYVSALCVGALIGIIVCSIHTYKFEDTVEGRLDEIGHLVAGIREDLDTIMLVEQYKKLGGNDVKKPVKCDLSEKTACSHYYAYHCYGDYCDGCIMNLNGSLWETARQTKEEALDMAFGIEHDEDGRARFKK